MACRVRRQKGRFNGQPRGRKKEAFELEDGSSEIGARAAWGRGRWKGGRTDRLDVEHTLIALPGAVETLWSSSIALDLACSTLREGRKEPEKGERVSAFVRELTRSFLHFASPDDSPAETGVPKLVGRLQLGWLDLLLLPWLVI